MTEFEQNPDRTHPEPAAMTDLDGPVMAAETVAARISTSEQPMGAPGRPFN